MRVCNFKPVKKGIAWMPVTKVNGVEFFYHKDMEPNCFYMESDCKALCDKLIGQTIKDRDLLPFIRDDNTGPSLVNTIEIGPEGTIEKAEPIIKYFEYSHLPQHLQEVSKPIGELAKQMASLPECAERTAGLRKLLEAKDCFVRAALEKK